MAPRLKIVKLVSTLCLAFALTTQLTCNAQYIGADSPVGVPTFHLKDGNTHSAGKAFAIQWFRGKKILLCPLHILGPTGGYSVQIEAKDIPNQVSSVEVWDFKSERIVATAGRGLLRTGKCDDDDWSQDLMAFEILSNSRLPLIPLCPTLVPVGTRVWVLSKTVVATSQEPDRFSGIVTDSEPTGITVKLDSKLTAVSSNGAPIVNAKNQLVGMLFATDGKERITIMGVPSTAIYTRLLKEVPQ